MDFSLHERRRLAQIEQDLSGDRRLVALLGLLESRRTKAWRLMHYTAYRVRRPRARIDPNTPHYRLARTLVIAALLVTLAGPVLLVTALGLGLSLLAVITVCVLPLPPLLLMLAYRWMRGLDTPRTARG